MNARSDGEPRSTSRTYPYGITWRNRRKPWLVKFKRNKRSINIGSYLNYTEAVLAIERFLRNEK